MTAEDVAARVAAVLGELGVCPFIENVNDGSMCICGLPALNHDEIAARVVLADHPAIAGALAALGAGEGSEAAGLRAVLTGLADKWDEHHEAGWTRPEWRMVANTLRALAARAGGGEGSGGEAG